MNASNPNAGGPQSSQTFAQLRDGLERGIEWLKQVGVSLDPESRFPYYLRVICELVDIYQTASEAEIENRFEEYSDALFEAADFSDTAQSACLLWGLTRSSAERCIGACNVWCPGLCAEQMKSVMSRDRSSRVIPLWNCPWHLIS